MNMVVIDVDVARKVLEVVDAGLVPGVGRPIPGQMCVEAAVCYALGLPHGDNPKCVSPALRSLKIRLNDSLWSSSHARAKGLRRLAVAQLGSAGFLDESEFIKRVFDVVLRKTIPGALRTVAELKFLVKHKEKLIAAAERCENAPNGISWTEAGSLLIKVKQDADTAAYAATAAAYAAYAAYAATAAAYAADATAYAATAAAYAADATAYAYAYAYAATAGGRDQALEKFAEEIVQILIDMKAPGCKWLFMTEPA